MKLLLRREQKSGMLSSKITFILDVRAELSEKEKTDIKKYKMGDMVLYSKKEYAGPTEGFKGLAASLAFRMLNLSVDVDDLSNGKKIDCKDIVEMLAAEQQVKEAAQILKNVLQAASNFGGEEVIEI